MPSVSLSRFDEVFPQILDDLRDKNLLAIDECADWFTKVVKYNVPHGKKNRGVATLETFTCLRPKATDDELNKACILGWCTEIMQAFLLVADDIMDNSLTRRGRTCWYKNDGVGLIAVNDAIFLDNFVYQILKKHFRDMSCYRDIVELFHEATHVTVQGQCLDMLSSCEGRPADLDADLAVYTLARYFDIVANKTAFYSFVLPVALALHLAGISDEKTHSVTKKIFMKLGAFFQVQDDYLDCYGDPAVTGKIGTDIEDGKCSWLICTALLHCSEGQRQTLQESYGKKDAASAARVKALYRDLDLAALYRKFEEASFAEVTKMAEELLPSTWQPSGGNPGAVRLPREVVSMFAVKIYKREK